MVAPTYKQLQDAYDNEGIIPHSKLIFMNQHGVNIFECPWCHKSFGVDIHEDYAIVHCPSCCKDVDIN